MRIKFGYSFNMSDENIAAYKAYHGIGGRREDLGKRALAKHIAGTCENVGTMGLDEQIHEGRQSLTDGADES